MSFFFTEKSHGAIEEKKLYLACKTKQQQKPMLSFIYFKFPDARDRQNTQLSP